MIKSALGVHCALLERLEDTHVSLDSTLVHRHKFESEELADDRHTQHGLFGDSTGRVPKGQYREMWSREKAEFISKYGQYLKSNHK